MTSTTEKQFSSNFRINHSGAYQYTINTRILEKLLYTENKLYHLLIFLQCSDLTECILTQRQFLDKTQQNIRAKSTSKIT